MTMEKNVLEWLDRAAVAWPDKTAYEDMQNAVTFSEVRDRAMRIASALGEQKIGNSPAAVILGRSVYTIPAFLGVAASGRAYAPIDAGLPQQRIVKILETLKPSAIVTEPAYEPMVRACMEEAAKAAAANAETSGTEAQKAAAANAETSGTDAQKAAAAANTNAACPVLDAGQLVLHDIDEEKLAKVRRSMTDTDPLYIIFTSGSSGNPKGVLTSHHSLMCYIEAYADMMKIDENDRLGNQSPLDYIAAIRDIYLPLLRGAYTYILPKEYFMQPDVLFDKLNEKEITCLGWSTSALTVLSSLGAFKDRELKAMKKICFSGSVMPGKVLRLWQTHLPEARFVNQYGPTEATASCTWYEVDHVVDENEAIPIGQAYDNYHVFLLNDDGTAVPQGEEGEICVTGPILALGYYNDEKRTNEAFVRNPLQTAYYERMYKTGDIGRFREDGVLEFHGRRDRQIKHMGHRVELDEIEYAANGIEGVEECAALYLKEKETLYLFYSGEAQMRNVVLKLRESLPGFMVPRKVKQLPELPKLPNGKMNMTALKELMR